MPRVRLFCDEAGSVIAVEHRPDELYTADNVPRDELRHATALVVEAEELGGVSPEELRVQAGKLQRQRSRSRRPAAPTAADRLAEIRATNKVQLTDTEWLRLFREYVTLTGTF